ncbi:MAG: hypothetical protein R3C17_08620 [Planctomycetaceae bacterium]
MSTPNPSQPGKLPLIIFATLVLLLTTAYVVITKTENSSQVRLEDELKKQREADKEATNLMTSIAREEELTKANEVINTRGLWTVLHDDAKNATSLLEQLSVVHQRNLKNEAELLDADAAVFAANPNEHVVLFRDFQKQLEAGTTEIQTWNTKLKLIVDKTTNMLTLSQLGKNPPAEDSQYVLTARGEIRDLLNKMEVCDVFFNKRKAESAAVAPVGTTLRTLIAEADGKTGTIAAAALQAELKKIQEESAERIRRIVLKAAQEKHDAEEKMEEDKRTAQNERRDREKREQDEAQAAEKAEAEAKAKIVAEDRALKADMRKVEKLLYQFTTKTNKQLKPDGYFDLTAEPTAISLKALIAYGALKPGNDGNFKLKQAMGMMAEKGDRPQAPIDVFAFDHSNAIPIQNLLIKHGDAMVRAGLLAP